MKSTNNINKKYLFEYLVYLLEQWRQEEHCDFTEKFTKLKLQKILFLVASYNADKDNHPLLDVFNNFYALPYGPVEIDIYESMNSSEFRFIKFISNNCTINFEELAKWVKSSHNDKSIEKAMTAMENSLEDIKKMKMDKDYIVMPTFDLVDITHKWTSWQVAMRVAEIFGKKRERMTTDDICNSRIKAYE